MKTCIPTTWPSKTKTYQLVTWIAGEKKILHGVSLKNGDYIHPDYGKLDKAYIKNLRQQ